MFFKRLELFGFKSFAQKTRLDFEAGVTAIVGPNGCGKTNLLDSIKWVLGEQSVRSMRGSSMEDVIFHGAEAIPGVGFAEVSLTISNQNKLLPLDYEELTITRRIFRSGESEYLINKIPVRLKDILELLMDTGLGVHSYSLMEQGRVDQILSSRPEERRAIFEEASGITKYKSKKEEALRRLERTGENLQRIGDIIVEVKRQIKSMERQVNRAQRYKQEFARLKEYELKVAQHQYRDLKKEQSDWENKIKVQEKEEALFSSKIDSTVQTLEKAKADLSSLEQNISQMQAENFEVSAAIKTAKNKVALDEERREELTRRNDDLGQQIENLEKKINIAYEQIKDVQDQIKTVEQKKQAKTTFLAEKEESIKSILRSVKDTQEEISQDKGEEVEIIAQKARLRNDLTKLQANMANLNARLRRLNIEGERTGQELNNVEERYNSCLGEVQGLNEQLAQLSKEVGKLRSELNIKSANKDKLTCRLEECKHQITALQSKLNFLKEITKRYEGFSPGVQSILEAIDSQTLKIAGVCGVVANLLEVKPEYQLAVEFALGENAQSIVVENRQAAVELINYLKEKDKGRANFICLDSLDTQEEKDFPRRPDCFDPIQEYIKIEPKYQKVLGELLANTFIVPDAETADDVLKSRRSDIKLVTLKGEILTRTSIIGGSLPKNFDAALLGRREKITQTTSELERIKKEQADLVSLQDVQESEINKLSGLIEQKEPGLNELKIKLANKKSEKLNIEAERKRFQDEISVLKVERDEAEQEKQQLLADEEDLNQELGQLQAKQKELQQKLQSYQDFIAEKNQERQNTLVQIAEAKTQSLALDREAEDTALRLKMLLESEAEQKQAKEAQEKEREDITAKIEQLKQEIIQLELQSKDLSQTKLNVEEKMSQAMQQRQGLCATIQNLEGQLRENQKQLYEVREQKSSLQVNLTELSYKQSSLKERMHQNYQIDLEATLENISEIPTPEASIFDEIKFLKTKLEGMGPVNLVAIEENEQLQQRYSFLVSQQEDLTCAQESLRKAIAQINHTARRMFAETFQKIQVSFKEYFRILFGGGDARLILLDENSILESGIEIVVRPPGKRLQNISLLSGGEKALTAIALLFAIFKVKPSPFCILDEVDAPLDEANIDRFTNLLSEFIKTSQFIIITHNKKTINMADIMYGITMEKSGVSKIVSVRFTEKKELPAREVAQV